MSCSSNVFHRGAPFRLKMSCGPPPKYALCKHGPSCARHKVGECGYAHKLSEVSWPNKGPLYRRRWIDESIVTGRPAGIDLFVGQRYTYEQHSRLLKYVAHSSEQLPDWVNLYLWFERHPDYKPMYSLDLGWFNTVVLELDRILPEHCRVRGSTLAETPVSLLDWKPPFEWATNMYGFTFVDMMRYRLSNARAYWVSESILDYVCTEEDCFQLRIGDRFIVMEDEEKDWCWGVRYDCPRVGGYIPWRALSYTDDRVVLDYRPPQIDVSVKVFMTEHRAQHRHRDDLWCITPDGYDLRLHACVAVCFCDGATHDRRGFAVACNCIYPNQSHEWKQDAAGMKMFCVGSATSELVALCITFLNLLQDRDHYSNAMVYCDSQCTIKYVGDIDWQPSDLSGWVLYPLILHCRTLRDALLQDGRIVYVSKVDTALNRAHTLAHRTLQTYKQAKWTSYDCIAPFEEYLGL